MSPAPGRRPPIYWTVRTLTYSHASGAPARRVFPDHLITCQRRRRPTFPREKQANRCGWTVILHPFPRRPTWTSYARGPICSPSSRRYSPASFSSGWMVPVSRPRRPQRRGAAFIVRMRRSLKCMSGGRHRQSPCGCKRSRPHDRSNARVASGTGGGQSPCGCKRSRPRDHQRQVCRRRGMSPTRLPLRRRQLPAMSRPCTR